MKEKPNYHVSQEMLGRAVSMAAGAYMLHVNARREFGFPQQIDSDQWENQVRSRTFEDLDEVAKLYYGFTEYIERLKGIIIHSEEVRRKYPPSEINNMQSHYFGSIPDGYAGELVTDIFLSAISNERGDIIRSPNELIDIARDIASKLGSPEGLMGAKIRRLNIYDLLKLFFSKEGFLLPT